MTRATGTTPTACSATHSSRWVHVGAGAGWGGSLVGARRQTPSPLKAGNPDRLQRHTCSSRGEGRSGLVRAWWACALMHGVIQGTCGTRLRCCGAPTRVHAYPMPQVILKPDPGNPQELYLGSLEALGIDTRWVGAVLLACQAQAVAMAGAWGRQLQAAGRPACATLPCWFMPHTVLPAPRTTARTTCVSWRTTGRARCWAPGGWAGR